MISVDIQCFPLNSFAAMEQEPNRLAKLPALPRRDTNTLSVRFTEGQRKLIVKAAELRGWSPTNLLRTAALEKAAHIVNTSTPNRVDFRKVAQAIAVQVFGPRSVRFPAPTSRKGEKLELWDADIYDSLEDAADWEKSMCAVEVSPRERPMTFLIQLGDAAQYGGTEFLRLLIEASADIWTPKEPLPEPIDPNAV